MRSVASEKYNLPDRGFLSDLDTVDYYGLSNLRRDILERNYFFDDVRNMSENLGFVSQGELSTKKGNWSIHGRENYFVPNFPEGGTRVDGMLALYHDNRHLIMKFSEGDISESDFINDLKILTNAYIERPLIKGLPSKFLTPQLTNILGFAVGGIFLGGLLGYGLVPNFERPAYAIGAVIGEFSGPLSLMLANRMGEKRAIGRLSTLEGYAVQDRAKFLLSEEDRHFTKVMIQRDLYQALLDDGSGVTPEQFLNHIYPQMPPVLIDSRKKEREKEKLGVSLEDISETAISRMVNVVRLLPRVEAV
ncbi:hypothetical protein HYV89_04080 [Candidatus Woesearchaeota archaeon]|nr:hypothetical protein [Candidatus Woesearchaeota archaeon]